MKRWMNWPRFPCRQNMRGMTNGQPPAHKSWQTILIVEDDHLLRSLVIDVVEEAGFATREASNADEAMAVLSAHSDIDVLFTDITMPGSMDGLELAHAVRARWPLIKIVVVSARADVAETDVPPDSRFLQKPYHTDVMISAIRSLVAHGERNPADRFYLDV